MHDEIVLNSPQKFIKHEMRLRQWAVSLLDVTVIDTTGMTPSLVLNDSLALFKVKGLIVRPQPISKPTGPKP
jgi:hypothetical protein